MKNIRQIGSSSQLLGKIKHVPKHQPVLNICGPLDHFDTAYLSPTATASKRPKTKANSPILVPGMIPRARPRGPVGDPWGTPGAFRMTRTKHDQRCHEKVRKMRNSTSQSVEQPKHRDSAIPHPIIVRLMEQKSCGLDAHLTGLTLPSISCAKIPKVANTWMISPLL